jgi:hypothetical protein
LQYSQFSANLIKRIPKARQEHWENEVVFARAERDGSFFTCCATGDGREAWGSGQRVDWVGSMMIMGFARVRFTAEGQARVSDSEKRDDEEAEARGSAWNLGEDQ